MARGRPAEQGKILERQLQALELRKAGLSYRKIASKLGISHVQAINDVNGELKRLASLRTDSAEELRQLELERLDVALEGVMQYVKAGSPAHVAAMVRLMEQRAKLLGLYAPEKHDVNIDVTKLSDDELKRILET